MVLNQPSPRCSAQPQSPLFTRIGSFSESALMHASFVSPSVPFHRTRTHNAFHNPKMSVDSHVHIWTKAQPNHPQHPIPDIAGSTDDLLQAMDTANVQKALIVQPINYMFDHTYVTSALSHHPTRLFGIALANTTVPPQQACAEMQRLADAGFRGMRINPTLTDEGFKSETVSALMSLAAQLDIPVALFARPQHISDVQQLASTHPHTKIILDHFAFADSPHARDRLLALGKLCTNVYVKLSAWFRVSERPLPHDDLHAFIDSLVATYGAHRLLIGSDFPFMTEQYEYKSFWQAVRNCLSESTQRNTILQHTATNIYKL